MKNVIINFSVVMALMASCSPSSEKKAVENVAKSTKTDSISISVPEKKEDKESEIPDELSSLVPIDVLESKSTNVFEKYGIEFSGNCYSCDLAGLSITKNKMTWTNICDKKDAFEVHDFTFSVEGKKTIIKTAERTYILTQIDKAPVYELVIEGQKLKLDNKRISKYFTTKKALPLFKEHDCGDFEG
ncbi:hypothetical protein [Chryseobacterium sp. JK1]|uniref:hypothetical protein n=1 Tax=Chryseobacterium sp. JK1 TaxID=874294 RepID=UPI003D68FFFE